MPLFFGLELRPIFWKVVGIFSVGNLNHPKLVDFQELFLPQKTWFVDQTMLRPVGNGNPETNGSNL